MRRQSHHSGFTLIELMISVAIALLLVLGVNTIFKITSQAVGAGESVLASSRDARTVLQTMLADLTYVAPCKYPSFVAPSATSSGAVVGSPAGDAPCFIIRSEHIGAYRNQSDWQSATDQANPYHDDNLFAFLNSSHIAPVTFTNSRSHRMDRLGFFVENSLLPRQTSSDRFTYVAPSVGNNGQVQTGSDGWIVYGHSQQPNNTVITGKSNNPSDWPDPGAGNNGTNDHNYYASDFMLTRIAIMLNPNANSANGYQYLLDDGSVSGLAPLARGSKDSNGDKLEQAVIDVAGTTMALWGAQPPPLGTRKQGLVSYCSTPNMTPYWWDLMMDYRFQVGPYMLSDPKSAIPVKISAYGLGKCSPNLIRGCSQFIVEFAGSYYTKNPNGTAAAFLPNPNPSPTALPVPQTIPTPDGQIDFVVDPVTGARQVRWYGFPRAVVTPAQGASGYLSSPLNPDAGDVVPLRDVLAHVCPPGQNWSAYYGTIGCAERFSSNFPTASSGNYTNYSDIGTMDPSKDQKPTVGQPATSNYTYTAAWGPDVTYTPFPKLIRIIIGIDDHEGRLNQPQMYEFVYQLQPK